MKGGRLIQEEAEAEGGGKEGGRQSRCAVGEEPGRCGHRVRRGVYFFFSSRRRHTRLQGDWSSDVCSSDLRGPPTRGACRARPEPAVSRRIPHRSSPRGTAPPCRGGSGARRRARRAIAPDRKSVV